MSHEGLLVCALHDLPRPLFPCAAQVEMRRQPCMLKRMRGWKGKRMGSGGKWNPRRGGGLNGGQVQPRQVSEKGQVPQGQGSELQLTAQERLQHAGLTGSCLWVSD